jgi:hypothetical protein
MGFGASRSPGNGRSIGQHSNWIRARTRVGARADARLHRAVRRDYELQIHVSSSGENTLLILRGAMAEVVGIGYVSVIDVARDDTKPYLRMDARTQRDLSK